MKDTSRESYFAAVESVLGYDVSGILINAYQLSKALHRTQSRKTGERYFEHPRAVGLLALEFGPTSFLEQAMALLHDSIEDCWILPDLLHRAFGSTIGLAVEQLSECRIVVRTHGRLEKVMLPKDAYFSHLMAAPAEVRRVKLCDRLHNLRTMSTLPPDSIRKKLEETRLFVLPLARSTHAELHEAIEKECCLLEAGLWR